MFGTVKRDSLISSVRRKLTVLASLVRKKQRLATLLLTNTSFRFFRGQGVNVTPVHYYSPIPDFRDLKDRSELWCRPRECPGIDFRADQQRILMLDTFSRYSATECDFSKIGAETSYHTSNIYFGYVSAVVMHSLVREYKPRRVLEVGVGNSSLVIGEALIRNRSAGYDCEFVGIDPYPPAFLRRVNFPINIIREKIEDVDLELFAKLRANDILSIDSSHTVRTGGDVNFLYLEVLPRLVPGVFIHVHDIFLPYEYPKEWLMRRVFWNEQYLLHALLIDTRGFEVVWAQRLMEERFPEEYQGAFKRISEEDNHGSYSFWLRKTKKAGEYVDAGDSEG
jgi:hypothetical protein